jgi:hypothetical protein
VPVSPDHPKQRLLFALEPGYPDTAVRAVKVLVDKLRGSRDWVVAPPEFVNEATEAPAETPIHTLGAHLDLYVGHGEWADRLPAEIDRALFEEVSSLVQAFTELSRQFNVEVALELDDDQIGWIEQGVPDRGVAQVFLGEWERSLKKSELQR